MSLSLTSFATSLISTLGYTGLVIGLVLDSFGVPIPSEVLIPVATILAEQGRFNLVAVFILGVAAQVAGGLISYYIGYKGGEPAVEKFGRYLFVSKYDLDRTRETFRKYGRAVTAIGRCIPVIRGLVGFPAGIAKMPIGEYTLYTAIGSSVWTAFLVGIGLWASANLAEIDAVMQQFSLLIIIALLLMVFFHFRRAIAERRAERTVGKDHA